MTTLSDAELANIRIKDQEFELKRAQLAMDLAKYGFYGILSAAIVGMLLILALAILDAFSDFTFGTYGVLGTAFLLAICVVSFGAYSLARPLRVLGKFGKMTFDVTSKEDTSKT